MSESHTRLYSCRAILLPEVAHPVTHSIYGMIWVCQMKE